MKLSSKGFSDFYKNIKKFKVLSRRIFWNQIGLENNHTKTKQNLNITNGVFFIIFIISASESAANLDARDAQ